MCTSKTQAEVEACRREMGILDPFIVENGGGIFIPKGYFDIISPEAKEEGSYQVIESNIPHANLLAALDEIKRRIAPQALGFSDLSPEWLAEITGLSRQQAILAKNRRYDEPFLAPEDESTIEEIKRIVQEMGLRYCRGARFHHITGPHDKGTAVKKLQGLFRHNDPDLFSVGLGEGPNDIPLWEQVDLPIVVQNKEGQYHPALDSSAYLKAPAMGPKGWSIAVSQLLGRASRQSKRPSKGEEKSSS